MNLGVVADQQHISYRFANGIQTCVARDEPRQPVVAVGLGYEFQRKPCLADPAAARYNGDRERVRALEP
jgi:hypothetical protein